MASSRDEQQIEFRGICLSEPFKNQEIEGRINLSLADSLRFTQKSKSDYRESKSDYNTRSSNQQNYNYRDERGGSNYRDERSNYGSKSSRDRGRFSEENSGDALQLLIVLFSLIFFVNLVASQLISSSSSSSYERVPPSYPLNADY
jgi:hypothetical protein